MYLLTISRALDETISSTDLQDISVLTREQVGRFVVDAFNNPVPGGQGGRPRAEAAGLEGDSVSCRVLKMVVFQEQHGDGGRHFHVAVRLALKLRFAPVKRTLRERYGLPSHFSSTHSNFSTAVRYGVIPTEKKPVVDDEPHQWTADGSVMDLFAESQQPFLSSAWLARGQALYKKASSNGRRATFTKLDLTALVLDRKLCTKAAVLEYCQNSGTVEMQGFVHRSQRKLKEFIEERRVPSYVFWTCHVSLWAHSQ